MDLLYQGVVDGQHHARALGRGRVAPRRPGCSACTRARASSRPGADADIVIYDPHGAARRISVETHHMNMDYSAYEGTEITGKVDTVLSRGEVIIDDGDVPRHARATAGTCPAGCRRTCRLDEGSGRWTSASCCRPTRRRGGSSS